MNDSQMLKNIMASNIKRLLESKGRSQTDMAVDLDLPEMTVSNWINAKTYPRPDKVQMMADYFSVSRSSLTESQPTNLMVATPQTIPVPILGYIACGDPILAEENIEGYRYESPDRLPSGNVFYLRAKGDSMEPTIPDGSFVLIRQQPEVESGDVAAVLFSDNSEATLKRVKKQGDIVILLPDNKNYEPIILTSDAQVKIIGKALQFTQSL